MKKVIAAVFAIALACSAATAEARWYRCYAPVPYYCPMPVPVVAYYRPPAVYCAPRVAYAVPYCYGPYCYPRGW